MNGGRCGFRVLVLSRAGPELAPVPAAADDGAVPGAVTDTTGLPVHGVTVDAPGAAGPVLTAATYRAGESAIAGFKAGAYKPTSALPCVQTVARTVTVEAGSLCGQHKLILQHKKEQG